MKSIVKQPLPKTNKMFSLVKSTEDMIRKEKNSLNDFQTQVHNFSDTPSSNFVGDLKSRYPTSKTFKSVKGNDYGLSKDLIKSRTGHFSLNNDVKSSSFLNNKVPKTNTYTINKNGIPTLNNSIFGKLQPKNMDYRYVDPQTYEYKLKGLTQQQLIRNKMREEGEKDTSILDPTSEFIKWREQDLNNKVAKIQALAKGNQVRQNLREGLEIVAENNAVKRANEEPEDRSSIVDTIKAGKAKRRRDTEAHMDNIKRKEEIRKQAKEGDDELIAYDEEKEHNEKMKKQHKKNRETQYTPMQKTISKLFSVEDPSAIKHIEDKGIVTKIQKAAKKHLLRNEIRNRIAHRKGNIEAAQEDRLRRQEHEKFDKLSPKQKEEYMKNLRENEEERVNIQNESKVRSTHSRKSLERMEKSEEIKKKVLNEGHPIKTKLLQDKIKAREKRIKAQKAEEITEEKEEGGGGGKLIRPEKAYNTRSKAIERPEKPYNTRSKGIERPEKTLALFEKHQSQAKKGKGKEKEKEKRKWELLADEGEDPDQGFHSEIMTEVMKETRGITEKDLSESQKKTLITQENKINSRILDENDKISALELAINKLEKTKLQNSSAKMSQPLKDLVMPALAKLNIHKVHGSKEVQKVYKELTTSLAAARFEKQKLEKVIKELPRKIKEHTSYTPVKAAGGGKGKYNT